MSTRLFSNHLCDRITNQLNVDVCSLQLAQLTLPRAQLQAQAACALKPESTSGG
jgi:hypothetical protein